MLARQELGWVHAWGIWNATVICVNWHRFRTGWLFSIVAISPANELTSWLKSTAVDMRPCPCPGPDRGRSGAGWPHAFADQPSCKLCTPACSQGTGGWRQVHTTHVQCRYVRTRTCAHLLTYLQHVQGGKREDMLIVTVYGVDGTTPRSHVSFRWKAWGQC